LCALVRSYLCQMGFAVFVSTSVARAEGLFLREARIHVWLIDAQSLGLEAVHFAVRIRELHPEAPIIVFSSAVREQDQPLRPLLDEWTWVRKPLIFPDLLSMVQGMIRVRA
jgi:DNA-binding response OmpR family regulator